jgi:hypothetical protein
MIVGMLKTPLVSLLDMQMILDQRDEITLHSMSMVRECSWWLTKQSDQVLKSSVIMVRITIGAFLRNKAPDDSNL